MRVLVVGLGSIARKHIKALRTLNQAVQVTALRYSHQSVEEEGIQSIYNWDEIKESPHFVLISNPTNLHGEAILSAIELNKPIFIEKPVLSELNDVNKLKSKIKEKGLLTYVGCNLRFHPCLQFLKNYINQKRPRINEVNIYCGSDLSNWRPGTDYSKSYSASAEMGGGVHLDLIHEFDYAYWLFGKPDEVISLKRKVSELNIDSYDFGAFHLNYSHFTINITLNYYRKKIKRGIEIVTEDGVLYADLVASRLTLDEQEIYSKTNFIMEETYQKQMCYFIENINKKAAMMNDFDEAVEVLKIATS